MRILFQDDEQAILKIATMIFMDTDHTVLLSNSVAASRCALSNDFDLLIIDLNMGHEDTFDVLDIALQRKIDVWILSGCITNYKARLLKYAPIIKRLLDKPDGFNIIIQELCKK